MPAAKTKALTPKAIDTLIEDVQALLERGRDRADRASNQQTVETYWRIGKAITKARLGKDAAQRAMILREIAEAVKLNERVLQRTVVFSEHYGRVPKSSLSWAHYRILVQVADPKERGFYEKLAMDSALSSKKLQLAVHEDRYAQELAKGKKKPGARLPRPTDPEYLYEAYVFNVVDADTLHLDVDLGFETLRRQRFRLARIDAPEPSTAGGREAKRFVMQQLAAAERIVVKTQQVDVHGRYIAHVFFSLESATIGECFAKGRYLNEELVKKGFARRV